MKKPFNNNPNNSNSGSEKSRYFGNYEKSACSSTSCKDKCKCRCNDCDGKKTCGCGCNSCNCNGMPKGHCCE